MGGFQERSRQSQLTTGRCAGTPPWSPRCPREPQGTDYGSPVPEDCRGVPPPPRPCSPPQTRRPPPPPQSGSGATHIHLPDQYLKAPAAVAGQGQPTVVHLKTPKATPKAYSKTAPLIASIKEKYRITKPGSGKNTQHIVIDLKDSGLKYQCGDSLGIFPSNNPLVVSRTIFALGSQPNVVLTKEKKTLEEVLSKSLNISRVTSALAKYVLDKNVAAGANNAALQELKAVASDAPKLTKYLENFEVWDFLQVCDCPPPLSSTCSQEPARPVRLF